VFKPQFRVLVIAFFFTFFLGDLAENLGGEALFPKIFYPNSCQKLYRIYCIKPMKINISGCKGKKKWKNDNKVSQMCHNRSLADG
jgi:hypothetical protein